MIHKLSVRASDHHVAPNVQQLRQSLDLPDLMCWQDYYLEFVAEPTAEDLAALGAVLSDGIDDRVVIDEPLSAGMVQVAHRKGVVDNENESLIQLAALVGLAVKAGKIATTYQSASPQLADIIRAARYNHTIEELHESEPDYKTLVPVGGYVPAQRFDLLSLNDDELAALGKANGRNLTPVQMRQIRDIQQATGSASVSDVLLEALDARWSDHCLHTTWRALGNLLPRLIAAAEDTKNPNIVSMFHDNAGVWDFYDGYSLAIKAETHNGPSAIAAYFGQLTKLGGVLRDIMGTGLGADPIGCFEYTATGVPELPAPISDRPAPKQIATDTIRAIKEYGNTFGVPMMSSRMTFHPDYRAKPFALGGSIGLLPTDKAQRGTPQPGDVVMLIGGRTGAEGIHGAAASSAGATMDTAAVQIGAPLEQVTFRSAIMELRDSDCLRALTDVGGAGLNSAVGEIGEACGVWMNTALVPLRTAGLPMWCILVSESQERMVLAIPPSKLAAAQQILHRHRVRATVIGRFTDSHRYAVFHNPELTESAVIDLPVGNMPDDLGEPGFDIPYSLLEFRPAQQEVSAPPSPAEPVSWPDIEAHTLTKLVEQVMADGEIASQRFANAQYDSTVQGNTYYGPEYGQHHRVPTGYWAGTPVAGSSAAAVVSTAFNPWLFSVDPVRALRHMFVNVLSGQILAGVDLRDICLCDNFYTPHLADHANEWLVGMVDELADLVRTFGTPVISGKDSSAGSTHTDEGLVNVPPAVFLTALGKVPDAQQLLQEAWTTPGNVLVRIGPDTGSITGTVAARVFTVDGGQLDDISLDSYRDYLAAIPQHRHMFRSGTMIGPGGTISRLVLGSLATGLGVDVADQPLADLFAEHRCGAIVEMNPADVASLPAALSPVLIGQLTDTRGVRVAGVDVLTPTVEQRWAESFAARIA